MNNVRIIRKTSRLCVLIAFVVTGISCSSPRQAPPASDSPQVQQDPKLKQGQSLFTQNCYKCHPNGEAGLGPSLKDKPLPAVAIKTQIRNGFGAMPAFKEDRLTDAQVDRIVAYVQFMHKEATEKK